MKITKQDIFEMMAAGAQVYITIAVSGESDENTCDITASTETPRKRGRPRKAENLEVSTVESENLSVDETEGMDPFGF